MLKRNQHTPPLKKNKGQSTVEYIILVAAVIAAVFVFITGTFRTQFGQTLNSASNGMKNMADRLSASRP